MVYENPLWERACSRMRFNSQQIRRLTYRFREQARSHIVLCCLKDQRYSSSGTHAQNRFRSP